MPYVTNVNMSGGFGSAAEKHNFIRELNALRAELDDMRTKYAALLTKLDNDAGVTDTNYGTTVGFAARQFTPT